MRYLNNICQDLLELADDYIPLIFVSGMLTLLLASAFALYRLLQ